MYAEVKEYIEKADKLAKGVVQKENLPEVKEIREKCLHAIEYIQSQLQQENSKYKPFHAAYGGGLMDVLDWCDKIRKTVSCEENITMV